MVEAARLEQAWTELRALEPDVLPRHEVVAKVQAIDLIVGAVERRHFLGRWARGARIDLAGEAKRLLGEEGRLLIPPQWAPL